MKRFAIFSLFLVTACADIQSATDKAGRDAAKTILPETLAVYFPQVPKAFYEPFTNCVVDNALAAEVQSLAGDVITGVDTGTADTVRGILARSETQACLARSVPTDLTGF
ncbi:MAG: hypothetical protein V2I76_03910 [Roseobacter sp.]|jgi:hypothetical protein|nr:hypothetical protein [Roseobacter sp.]